MLQEIFLIIFGSSAIPVMVYDWARAFDRFLERNPQRADLERDYIEVRERTRSSKVVRPWRQRYEAQFL